MRGAVQGVFMVLALLVGLFAGLVAYSAFGYFGAGAALVASFVLAGVAGGGSDV